MRYLEGGSQEGRWHKRNSGGGLALAMWLLIMSSAGFSMGPSGTWAMINQVRREGAIVRPITGSSKREFDKYMEKWKYESRQENRFALWLGSTIGTLCYLAALILAAIALRNPERGVSTHGLLALLACLGMFGYAVLHRNSEWQRGGSVLVGTKFDLPSPAGPGVEQRGCTVSKSSN